LGLNFALFAALPLSKDSGDSGAKQQYAVIKSYSLTGVKNVRWETSPMNYVDANGKPMPSKSGCDYGTVKAHANGEEYERPNGKFKYRCTDGIEEVVACVGSERTNKARIEVGQTLDINGFWHKCQSFPNMSVAYTQETSCSHGGKDYRVGEEVLVGFLRLNCLDSGYKVVRCFYVDENQKPVSLNPGEKKEVGKEVHHCEEKNNTLQYFSKKNGCAKADKQYKEEEVFSANHLRYKCSNGMADVTGCYISETRDLAIGQDVVDNSTVYRCYRLGGKIEYTEYACGMNGTPSCTPEPIPQTPDDVPSLARGLVSPGVGSFSVVETAEGGVAASPSKVHLELDKKMAVHE